MKITILRCGGTEETHDSDPALAIRKIQELIGADVLDTVNLRDGHVMLVDDTGFLTSKPRNPKATELYHSVCKPGTTHPICGDAAIVVDANLGD